MQITWTSCAERMPPDGEDEAVIAIADLHGDRPFITDAWTMNNSKLVLWHKWTPYTKEKWEALNK